MNRLDFKFDTEVYGIDKQCGRLAKAAIDPQTWQLTNLVIENGLLFKRARVVPMSKLDGIVAQAVYLAVDSHELRDYPDHQEIVVEESVPKRQEPLTPPMVAPDLQIPEPYYSLTGVPEMPVVEEKIRTGTPDDSLLLDGNTAVDGLEGNIGRLSHLITGENFQISHLVVAQGKLLARQIMIPVHLVETMGENRIHVLATDAEVNEFPEFGTLNGESGE